jgi:hypothetical protein
VRARAAAREAMNHVRRERLTAQALGDGGAPRALDHEDENGALPYIVCGEGWEQKLE